MSEDNQSQQQSFVEAYAEMSTMSHEDILNLTQTHRKMMVDSITGAGMPEDPAVQRVLLDALTHMDKSVFDSKRTTIEETANANMSQAMAYIAKLKEGLDPNTFGTIQGDAPPRTVTLDDSGMEPLELVEDHLAVGSLGMDYATFIAKNENLRGESDDAEDSE